MNDPLRSHLAAMFALTFQLHILLCWKTVLRSALPSQRISAMETCLARLNSFTRRSKYWYPSEHRQHPRCQIATGQIRWPHLGRNRDRQRCVNGEELKRACRGHFSVQVDTHLLHNERFSLLCTTGCRDRKCRCLHASHNFLMKLPRKVSVLVPFMKE